MRKNQNHYEVVSVGEKMDQFYNSYQYRKITKCLNAYGGKDIASSRQFINDFIDRNKKGISMSQINRPKNNFSFGKK